MIGVLYRYRFIIAALLLALLAALIWFIAFRQDGGKAPSRGVFVMNQAGYLHERAPC